MKLSIFYQHILRAAEESGEPVASVLQTLKCEGLEAVELNLLHADAATVRLLTDAGLAVSSIYEYVSVFSGETKGGFSLVDRAFEVGCKTVMLAPGSYPETMSKEEAQRESFVPLEKIAAYGARRGITVTVEDYDSRQTLFDTSADLLRFGDAIPDLYYTFDSGNFYAVEDPLHALSEMQNKVRHVHLKDMAVSPLPGHTAARETRAGAVVYDVPFGQGALPCAEILTALKTAGYKGFLCLEHSADKGAMPEANLAAIRWVKQYSKEEL